MTWRLPIYLRMHRTGVRALSQILGRSQSMAKNWHAAKTLLVTVFLELAAKRTIRLRVPYTELRDRWRWTPDFEPADPRLRPGPAPTAAPQGSQRAPLCTVHSPTPKPFCSRSQRRQAGHGDPAPSR